MNWIGDLLKIFNIIKEILSPKLHLTIFILCGAVLFLPESILEYTKLNAIREMGLPYWWLAFLLFGIFLVVDFAIDVSPSIQRWITLSCLSDKHWAILSAIQFNNLNSNTFPKDSAEIGIMVHRGIIEQVAGSQHSGKMMQEFKILPNYLESVRTHWRWKLFKSPKRTEKNRALLARLKHPVENLHDLILRLPLEQWAILLYINKGNRIKARLNLNNQDVKTLLSQKIIEKGSYNFNGWNECQINESVLELIGSSDVKKFIDSLYSQEGQRLNQLISLMIENAMASYE